ncbi:glycosyltransferase, partial [uncultured Winogradskyella sp.]|uniref:glycosyltransferase n=1 Tax=uncultured Winogradskyella sp. TaxID=395353 RepID=UPI0030EEE4F4
EFVGKKGKNVLHFNKIKQNQLQFLYDKASLFLMPTNYEIFGMVYLECMHFGVPVITTLNAGSMDLFENNYDSFIVDSLNLKEWIEKIDHIINSNIGADFSQRLKKKSSKYDWSTISDTYLREYQNVVSLFNK